MTDTEYRALAERSPKKAQRALFDEYFGFVFTIVYGRLRKSGSRQDADECTADVFSELFIYLEKHSPTGGDLRGIVGTIAKNRAVDAFRRLSVRQGRTVPVEEINEQSPEPSPVESAEENELRRILLRSISDLGEPDSRIILMKYYYDMSSGDIGSALGMAPAAVRMRASRAMKKLREILEKEGFSL